MELPIVLDRADNRPLPTQLAAEIHRLSREGVISQGEKLPSERSLAHALGIARNTVVAAYEQLHGEGWVTMRRGAGTFVEALPHTAPPSRGAPPARVPHAAAINLMPGAALPGGVEASAWRRAMRAAGDRALPHWPTDVTDRGFARVVAAQMLRQRGHAVDSESVLATGGTAAAVAELAQVLPPGSRVGVEDPGWPRIREILRGAGHEVVPVPVDEQGLRLDHAERLTAVICTPGHQFPLGVRLSAARRQELVAWARQRGAWIVEDDYDGEIRYSTAPLPLLVSLAPDRVIHVGSFSKILTPGLSCGWLVAPSTITDSLAEHRRTSGTRPAVLSQRVVAALGEAGDLDRHLRRVRRALADRRALVLELLGSLGVEGAESGSHVLLPLRSRTQEAELVRRLAGEGVLLDSMSRFCHRSRRCGVVLGYAGATVEDLGAGLRILARELAQCSPYPLESGS